MTFSTALVSLVQRLMSCPTSCLEKKASDWCCNLSNNAMRISVTMREPTQRRQYLFTRLPRACRTKKPNSMLSSRMTTGRVSDCS